MVAQSFAQLAQQRSLTGPYGAAYSDSQAMCHGNSPLMCSAPWWSASGDCISGNAPCGTSM
ncbi:hypothetical protein D777_01601 [Marinobacter nitratireducens]|uniref:Uncharacterized protein n=1 Tax=Marinobacter nitratireducens TaxID=1137280 RepID=A0A072NFM7_9GAMM|nr:hypothetical protein D777_01601 [Marinobacter nitratireducens]